MNYVAYQEVVQNNNDIGAISRHSDDNNSSPFAKKLTTGDGNSVLP